jgi:hypothetical protein
MSNWSRTAALLGEPDLPIEAFKHVGDRKIKPQGGGGQQTSSTQTSIPDYAKPYVQGMLGKADALTSAPYQAYEGERVAQFSPLQQQSYQGAQGLGPTGQLGTATGFAQQAGQAAQGASQYAPGQFQGGTFDTAAAQQYMSPYMQQVIDVEKQQAARQAGIAGTQQQAQAVGAGAFGGSRDAIMRSEAARNLAQQQGDIQTRGLQSAYQQAQGQFNQDMSRGLQAQQLGEQSRQFGSGLGLQGLGTMLQAANQLGSLGGEQFRQQVGTYGMQNQFGGQQQQQMQNVLDQRYGDFTTRQQDPYRQISFMSDLLRGVPLSGTQTTSQPGPSPLSQVGGAGLALYGLSRAQGGSIPAPAGLAELAVARMR